MDVIVCSRRSGFRCWLAALVLVAGWAVPAAALFFGGDRADPAQLEAGRATLEDGFYAQARDHLQVYLESDPDKASRAEAALLYAQALYGLGVYEDMVRYLDDHSGWAKAARAQARYAFWEARGLHALDRYDAALDRLLDIERNYPEDPIRPRAQLLKADALRRAGRSEEALAAYRYFADRYAAMPEGPGGLLRWGSALLEEQRREEAETVLSDLNARFPDTQAGRRAGLAVASLRAEDGRSEQATELLEKLAANEEAHPDLRARAWLLLGGLRAGGTNLAAAAEAYAAATSLAPAPELAAEGTQGRGQTLIRMGQTEEGMELMHAAVGAMTSGVRRAEGQLALAELLQAQGLHALAVAEFQTYLEAFEADLEQPRALRGKAWSQWESGAYAEAAATFDRALAQETNSEVRAEMMVKAADAVFADGAYVEASERYLAFAASHPRHPLAAQARFQEAESLARAGDDEAAELRWDALLASDGGTNLVAEVLLRRGILEEERGHWKDAVAWFDQIIADHPDQPQARQALHRRAVNRYRLGRFEEALGDFDEVVAPGFDTAFAEEAYYMRGWCHYMLGRDDEAVGICRDFLERFPRSSWAPRVLFWMGEYYWNAGGYEEAESRFVDLAIKYPDSPLADEGHFWAGRSAARRREFLLSVQHFGELAKDHADSPLMPEARFLQGDAMSELGRFQDAILAFEEVIRQWPDSYYVDAAWGRKGDCLFTLGTEQENPEDQNGGLGEAMAAYGTVAGSETASIDLQLQAGYKIGRCLEKMGKTEEAFRQYMDVAYAYLGARRVHGETDPIWYTQAAFKAAAIMKSQEKWEEAISIYRRVVRERLPASREAEKLIQEIRLKHWLPF